MAYIQDTAQSFMITLVGEGLGTLDMIIVNNTTTAVEYIWELGMGWSPSAPIAYPGDGLSLKVGASNNGVLEDVIYAEFVSAEVTPAEPLIQTQVMQPASGGTFANWSFTMPATDVNITLNAGHEE